MSRAPPPPDVLLPGATSPRSPLPVFAAVGIGLQSNDERVVRLKALLEEFAPAIQFASLNNLDMVTDCQIPGFIRGPFLREYWTLAE